MSTQRMPLMEIENDVSSTPVTNGRRKSGRAVKAPEKFVPEVASSQPRAAAAVKRKRAVVDAEDGASDDEEDEEDEVAQEESEEEPEDSADEDEPKQTRGKAKTKKPAAVKKPAAKKAKVNGTATNGSAPALRLPNRSKKAKQVVIADESADGLYAQIFTGEEELEEVARQFIERYRADGPEALTDIINLVLKCAGCEIMVTEDDINDADNINGRISDLQDQYSEQNITDYPLITRNKGSAAFRTSLLDFFGLLIKVMDSTEVLYDDEALLDNLYHWIASLSSSSLRPFRHTATLLAMTMCTAMSEVTRDRLNVTAKIRRQYESEKGSSRPNKARLADYGKRVQAEEAKDAYLQGQLNETFDTVFIHRYRDVDPKIRTESIEALGEWMVLLPSVWLQGTYLRYLGWMLTDDTAPMRLKVIQQLEEIMKEKDNVGEMRSFIERFRPRIIEIATRDSDAGVRSAAVDFVGMIRENGFLEPNDIDTIGKLIFDTEAKVRKSVVDFFVQNVQDLYEEQVDELGGEEVLEETLNLEDDTEFGTPSPGWIKLKSLAAVLLNFDTIDQEEMPSQVGSGEKATYLNVTGTESRFSLAAQALYPKLPEIQNWKMVAGYLLYDHSAKPSGTKSERAVMEALKPAEGEEIILLEVLSAAVRLALAQGEESDKYKDRSKKRAAQERLADAKETNARHLAEIFPKLLNKYGASPHTATAVLRLEHVLNLGVFQELRQDSTAYAKLLDEISNQFSGHVDKIVLNEASAALLHARSFEDLEDVTETKLQSLWESTISALRRIDEAGEVSVRGAFRLSILTELSSSLARLEKLASISNCVEPLEGGEDPLPINIIVDSVARGQLTEPDPEIDLLEDDVTVSAIRSSMFYFMWKVKSFEDLMSADEEIPDVHVDQLRDLQSIVITNLIATLSSRSTIDPVRLLATGTLLDLHVLFATHLRPVKDVKGKGKTVATADGSDRYEYLQTLTQEISPEVQAEITSIFSQVERHYAKKSNRKLTDPGDDEPPEDDDEPEDPDDEEGNTESERQSESLQAEQQLCELSGKIVIAILAKVIDASGTLKGQLRTRIERNRSTLGSNFKDIIVYLDGPKPKANKSKSHKSKAQQAAAEAKKQAKSKEVVDEEEDEDEDDPFAADEPEEGTAEDLRRRELVDDEEAPVSDEEDADAADADVEPEARADEDEDMLGD